MTGTRRANSAWYALAALGLACSLWLHLRLGDMGFDDTWIHLRIARNLLATGHAWFNTNERVMATSSPLWTILMAALHVPSHPSMLPVLEAVLLWSACVLAFCIARQSFAGQSELLRDGLSLLAAILTAALLLGSSVGQMESPLAVLLLLGAWRAVQRRSGMALPLFAMAAATRLEYLPVWLLATVVALVWSHRHRIAALEGIGIVLALAGWTLAQFHVLLPNSMRAKQISYDLSLRQSVQQFVGLRLRDGAMAALLFAVVVVAGALLWRHTRTGTSGAKRRQAALPLASTLLGLLLVLEYLMHRTVIFDWYRPLYLVPLTLGVLLLRPAVARASARRALAVAQVLLLAWFAAPAMHALPGFVRAAITPSVAQKSRIDHGDYARVQEYLEVGSVLQRACPGGRMLASEIGGLGWTFRGELLDGFGIASPGALQYQPLRSGAPKGGIPVAYLLQQRPDVVVSYTVMSVEPLASSAVQQQYDLLPLSTSPRSHRGGPLDHDWRSSPHLNVWLRKDSLCDRVEVRDDLRAQID